jgi:hypothetical protein
MLTNSSSRDTGGSDVEWQLQDWLKRERVKQNVGSSRLFVD